MTFRKTFQVASDSQKSPHNDISGIFGQLILIPKNLPKTTDCRKKYIGQNLHKMTFKKTFQVASDSPKSPQNDISGIFGRLILILKNLPKMTFRRHFRSLLIPQIDIFADAIISPNRQLFFWSIFPKKKKTITRTDPVTRSKTTRLNNFFMRKISHCKKKKLPFHDIMTLVFGQSLYRSIRLEIASFFFLQVLLKLMPVTNMIQAHAETQENSPGQQKIVRAHEFIFFSKKKTKICCIQHTCGVLPFLWVGSTPI